MAIKSNIVIDQGADFSITVTAADADGDTMDLSGYTGRSWMKKSPSSSNYWVFSVTINESAGEVVVSMTSDDTTDLVPGRYLYDVEIISPANKVTRLVEGIVTVTPEITRPV